MTLYNYMREVSDIAKEIDVVLLDKMVERLVRLKADAGRLFIVGVGGSAANAYGGSIDLRGGSATGANGGTLSLAGGTTYPGGGSYRQSLCAGDALLRHYSRL